MTRFMKRRAILWLVNNKSVNVWNEADVTSLEVLNRNSKLSVLLLDYMFIALSNLRCKHLSCYNFQYYQPYLIQYIYLFVQQQWVGDILCGQLNKGFRHINMLLWMPFWVTKSENRNWKLTVVEGQESVYSSINLSSKHCKTTLVSLLITSLSMKRYVISPKW
jgi:hypothetical protein